MIRSVLYLTPKQGAGGTIADFYRRRRVLEHALEQDGCVSAEVQLPTSGHGDVLVTALWRDEDAYQGWLDNPAREAHAGELAELVEGFDRGLRGDLYQVVVAVGTGA